MLKKAYKHSLSAGKTALHYFFNGPPSGAIGVVCSLLRQLLGQLLEQVQERPWGDIQRWATDIQFKRQNELESEDELKAIIKRIIHDNAKGASIRIYVDGIDERLEAKVDKPTEQLGDRPQPLAVLEVLSDLVSLRSAGIDIGVCVARRPTPVYSGLEPLAHQINLEDYTDIAIPAFLQKQLKVLGDPEREAILLQLLICAGSSNFLWAERASRDIGKNKHSFGPEHVEQLVSTVIDNHEDLYRYALSSASADDRRQLVRVLQIRLGTFRLLTAAEFRHALAFAESEGEKFAHDNLLQWEKARPDRAPGDFGNFIQEVSGGLLQTVGPPDRVSDSFTLDHEVVFSQRSVEHYLRGEKGLGELQIDSAMSLERACDLLLYKMCCTVLDHCKLRGRDDAKILDYALQYGLRHAQRCGELPKGTKLPDVIEGKCSLRKSQQFIKLHVKLLAEAQENEFLLLSEYADDDEAEDNLYMVLLLSTMGCKSLLRAHLQKCTVCDNILKTASTDDESTDIFWDCLANATMGGHEETARFLLELYSPNDINLQVQGMTPLYRACYSASQFVERKSELGLVRILLSMDADPCEPSCNLYEYPLQAAIALNNPQLIRELLHPSRAESVLRATMKECGRTALHFAIESPQRKPKVKLEILELLLKLAPKGLGLQELPDGDGRTPRDLAEGMDDEYGDEVQDLLEQYEDDDRKVK